MRHHYPRRVYRQAETQRDGNKLIVTSHNAPTHTHKAGANWVNPFTVSFYIFSSSSFVVLLCSQRETGHLNRYKNLKVLREGGGRGLEAGMTEQLTSASSMSTRLPGLRA